MARENRRSAKLTPSSRIASGQRSWPGASKKRDLGVATRTKFVKYTTP